MIGRSKGWSENKLRALHGLNRRLSGVMIMTYDHLLAQGERLIETLNPKPTENLDLGELAPQGEFDDDIPF